MSSVIIIQAGTPGTLKVANFGCLPSRRESGLQVPSFGTPIRSVAGRTIPLAGFSLVVFGATLLSDRGAASRGGASGPTLPGPTSPTVAASVLCGAGAIQNDVCVSAVSSVGIGSCAPPIPPTSCDPTVAASCGRNPDRDMAPETRAGAGNGRLSSTVRARDSVTRFRFGAAVTALPLTVWLACADKGWATAPFPLCWTTNAATFTLGAGALAAANGPVTLAVGARRSSSRST